MKQQITRESVALAGTVADEKYSIQNQTSREMYADFAAEEPDPFTGGILQPLEWVVLSHAAGEKIYVSGEGVGVVFYKRAS